MKAQYFSSEMSFAKLGIFQQFLSQILIEIIWVFFNAHTPPFTITLTVHWSCCIELFQ